MEQGSNEWLEWRRKGIGGSDIAAIVGVCKYSTPFKIWSEKVGQSAGFAGNFATERGKELEDRARAKYELLSMEDMPAALAIHPKFEILRVSLDGIREDRKKILEIKCPGRESHEIALRNQVPDHYRPQTQFQLAVTGADDLDYFSYTDQSHALVPVEPDIQYQGVIINAALDFWNNHVLTKIPPSLTDKDDKVISQGEVFELCKEIAARKDSLKKADIDSMKARVIRLGGHSRVRCGNVLVTQTTTNGKLLTRLTVSKAVTS